MPSKYDKPPVVCDNGTGYVKCGFAGDNFPISFPSLVGRPIMRANLGSKRKKHKAVIKDIMVGDECDGLNDFLKIQYPLENGQIRNWEDVTHIWDYVFNTKLKVDPTEHKILLTEPPMNPLTNRKKMFQNMFEKYKFPMAHVAIQAVLVLYAQGLNTGVVVDTGDGVTHVIPVFQGYDMPNLIKRLNVAGRDITRHLLKLMQKSGYSFNLEADQETLRDMKEKYCYVAHDTTAETKLALETTAIVEKFKLPDGTWISMASERFEAPEILFNPSLCGKEVKGVAECVFDAINGAALDIRPDFYKHIVLSGGTSMLAGYPSRLEKDITNLYVEKVLGGNRSRLKSSKVKIKIEDPPRRKNIVFLGGSVLANLMKDVDDDFWVTKEAWEEHGESLLHRKK